MAVAALAMSPQPPPATGRAHPPIRRSISEGLRFVTAQSGARRQLRDRPRRDDVRLAAVDVRGALADRVPRWHDRHRPAVRLDRVRRDRVGADRGLDRARAPARTDRDRGRADLGRERSPAPGSSARSRPAMVLFAIAGFADGVSAVCRSTINQTITPDALRGRMSALYMVVVTGGPAPRRHRVRRWSPASPRPRRRCVTGGLACIAGGIGVVLAFPALLRFGDQPDGRAHGPLRLSARAREGMRVAGDEDNRAS